MASMSQVISCLKFVLTTLTLIPFILLSMYALIKGGTVYVLQLLVGMLWFGSVQFRGKFP
jgi:hypothetical protein